MILLMLHFTFLQTEEVKMQLAFDHVHYRCSDLEAARRFYCDVLGAEYLETVELAGRPVMRLRLGGIHLLFSPSGEEGNPEPADRRLGAYHIAFFVEDHDAAVAHFKSRGAKFVREGVMASPHLKVAFIEAPDGMQVEIMQKL